MTCCPR
ncbi:hypothetical protein DGo_PE0026 (plasmid) [Deinococcus gobiensis I-0]|nr:hypothetical protein DGo_PE0026 [Deinococcus gobiensis I-0]